MIIKYELSPSKEFPWFITNPQGDTRYYRTKEDMLADQRNVIIDYCEDGWSEEVTEIMAGKIFFICVQKNRSEDATGEYGYICDYELEKL